jgi:hypothetical protein
MPSPEKLRHHLRFDVARLRAAAIELQAVDDALSGLKRQLEARARELAAEALAEPAPQGQEAGDAVPRPLRTAQAQATAELARRAALGEILRSAGSLPLIATMAVSRWVRSMLDTLPGGEGGRLERRAALVKGHIDAGRIAHRMLASLRSRAGLRSGCGQLVCAVVVAELAPNDLRAVLDEQIEEGWVRARSARGVRGEADALAAASAGIREAARLLEAMARRARPAAENLVAQAEDVEARVERDLTSGGRA